jgi:cytochrome c peroxidase
MTSMKGAPAIAFALVLTLTPLGVRAQSITTPSVPPELPVEIETDLAPGSLKQAPLWKELVQLLENPYAPVVRRPAFRQPGDARGQELPALNVWPLNYNFLTDQPLRLRTSDGEVSWDQPGPLFDPEETAASLDTDGDGTPDILRQAIGALVPSATDVLDEADSLEGLRLLTRTTRSVDAWNCGGFQGCGYLIVYNPSDPDVRQAAGFARDGPDPRIPPHGTIVAVPAVVNGILQELVAPGTTETEDVTDHAGVNPLEIPISELDFLRPADDVADLAAPLVPYLGRRAAEVAGKALFWDMQVGSDGVQACASCHFHAGVDNRTKNQLNPNHLGGDFTLSAAGAAANAELRAAHFPFRRLANVDGASEGPGASAIVRDSNDVASSMGVRFRRFLDIPPIGAGSFGAASNGVRPLLPDVPVIEAELDPIPAFQGLRRVEPRNTPTIINTAFNFDNFWDGRARFVSNGGSVFGPSDPQFHVFLNDGLTDGAMHGASNGDFRPDLVVEDPEIAEQPVRIKFASLASLATGPGLSDFEMSFAGRNWAKIGKKLLQGHSTPATDDDVTPLANQLVSTTDSVLGPFSNQGGSVCTALGRAIAANKPGICVSYEELIRAAFRRELWANESEHLDGAAAPCDSASNGVLAPAGCDPFDGYVLTLATGAAGATNTNHFRQIEANFSLFWGQSLMMWQELLISDDSPFDQFMDANPLAANAVAQPGEQGTLPPATIADAVGPLTLVPGFGPDEIFGFDVFSGANLTAALPIGSPRNPTGVGSNPFLRTARCMLCHFGPEGTDHSINVSHGLVKSAPEYELPLPFNSPEPTGPFRAVGGLILADEVEEPAQDVVEVEPRDMGVVDDPATPWDERVVSVPSAFAFGDNGIYNIGVRPADEDAGRGGDDAFGWPLSSPALALKNIGGAGFEPCDAPGDTCDGDMTNFDPALGPAGGLFDPIGAGLSFAGAPGYELWSINPGYDKAPAVPQLPQYMAPWISDLPAGELHPQIDELAFMVNTRTPPISGPAVEYGELLYGADLHCATWSGNLDPAIPGVNPPRWGALVEDAAGNPIRFRDDLCANLQSDVPGNLEDQLHGTWPFANRVGRQGAFKAPQLRNVELTGPYFHSGSYLTLRQVIDFYMRGGDFPVTNAEVRDQHIVNISKQVFGFGASTVADDPAYAQFAGGLPDTVSRYTAMPDTTQATPEYASQEDAKVALVKFLLALTDRRVKYEQAPFDHPEIFVPLDGAAPDNGGLAGPTPSGRDGFLNNLANGMFRQVAAVGSAGGATPLPNFLGIASTPGPGLDHFDRITDANGNVTNGGSGGPATLADALRVLQLAVGLTVAPPQNADDFTFGDVAPQGGDGALTVADALLILRAATGLVVL